MILPLSEAVGVGLLAAVARLVVVWLFGFAATNPTTGPELSAGPAHEVAAFVSRVRASLPAQALSGAVRGSFAELCFGLCLLLAELRVVSQWKPSIVALLGFHFAWVVVVVAARQWGSLAGGAAANTLFAGQLVGTVAGGAVLAGWTAAAARFGRALELAQAVMPDE
ncbi:hypothetical protein FNF27_03297 [Cafeteria roenbergensis]|uniref:Uncharacterized protein n=1 Tax=Cafeteria roenbergensis TaxID=33653 RepID=A0A5A8ECM8_CAFRO|nr:hypothetical protein FNF27_03297 [Cafeteria roenbergensis]